MTLELSFPPKFLDFPIHKLIQKGSVKDKPEDIYSNEGIIWLRKRVLQRAFEVLGKFDIDEHRSIGALMKLAQKNQTGLYKKTPISEALKVIFATIGDEIERLNPGGAKNNFELIGKQWDLEILATTNKNQERTLGGQELWSRYGDIFHELYKKHGNPKNITGRLRAIRRELEGGGGHVSYRGQWREAHWETQLSTLRILEFQYLLENNLFSKEDQPEYC